MILISNSSNGGAGLLGAEKFDFSGNHGLVPASIFLEFRNLFLKPRSPPQSSLSCRLRALSGT
ncbi:MAG: hypothetical protein VCB63_06045, partial [Alphaproteobacteria bacterium]